MSTQEISLLVSQLAAAARPRCRRPSERNLRIYEAVRVRNESQLAVACEQGLSQQRISVICRQVETWLREDSSHSQNADDRRRTERWLARRRLEEVHGWSLRGLQASAQTLSTRINWEGSNGITGQTISKDQTFDVRWLKVAQSSAVKLLELAELPEPPPPPPQPEQDQKRLAQANRVIRLAAALRRLVRREGAAACMPQIVEQVLRTCLVTDKPPAVAAESPPKTQALAASEADRCNCSDAAAESVSPGCEPAAPAADGTVSAAATCDEPPADESQHPTGAGGRKISQNTTVSPGPTRRWFKVPTPPLDQEHHAALNQLAIVFERRLGEYGATDYLNLLLARQAAGESDTGFSPEEERALHAWRRVLEASSLEPSRTGPV